MLNPIVPILIALVGIIAAQINKRYWPKDKAKNLRWQGNASLIVGVAYLAFNIVMGYVITPPDVVFIGLLVILGSVFIVISYRMNSN
ncbi:hypothetical protein OIT44_00245 [Weissella ceti]|uniref:Integral membrane protein n=1 Tax=Weissella ceti TaxID=759620 RepID=A0ABT3E2F9_9LACO|nr:hypothetical protein [Weissella ceti]MCW0952525.1 hypothetical protein [Weissella ceti]QVK11808.1 hypothetical protein KHQ31_06225 [Weissella ceti]